MTEQELSDLIEKVRQSYVTTPVHLPRPVRTDTSYNGCCPRCDEELLWSQDWLSEHVDAPGRLSHLEPGNDHDATQVVSFYDRCPNCHAVLHVVARITVTFDIHASAPSPTAPHEFYD